MLSEIYQYAWSLGLKTTYYLRTMGASRIEKSTISLAKYGDKNSVESQAMGSSTASTESPTPSTIIIQETVAVTGMNLSASVPSPAMFTDQLNYGVKTSTPELVEVPAAPKVALAEPKAFSFGQTSSVEPQSASEMTLTRNPNIEIMGEVCESCSA